MNENTNPYKTGLPFKGHNILLPVPENYDELCRKHLQVVACPKHAVSPNP